MANSVPPPRPLSVETTIQEDAQSMGIDRPPTPHPAASHPLHGRSNSVAHLSLDTLRAQLERVSSDNQEPPQLTRTFSTGITPSGRYGGTITDMSGSRVPDAEIPPPPSRPMAVRAPSSTQTEQASQPREEKKDGADGKQPSPPK